MNSEHTDILIIGTGVAGLSLALKMSAFAKVTLISKESLQSTNTVWAQGGIASVTSTSDSFEKHVFDTLQAGAGLCRPEVVKQVVNQAPDRIKDLVDWGVSLDKNNSSEQYNLTQEGGHSQRRILHFEDSTGLEIHRTLIAKVKNDPNIRVFENAMAIDLILSQKVDPNTSQPNQCWGAYVLDRSRHEVVSIEARHTVLASGGAGKVYLYTSNWSGATGDGIAMAFRAGAKVSNLEFMQFHPTCLYHPNARNFLISEALRGEGGELVTKSGVEFMSKYHPLKSLAPRDIVARSIDAEMKKSGDECVFLKMTHHSRSYLEKRFPLIFQKCLELGLDMSIDHIPVVPAAHYLCGGVETDLAGQCSIKDLFVIGESANTGLHGANRLASNSLLECLAMAHECAILLKENLLSDDRKSRLPPQPWIHPEDTDSDELIVIHHMWDEIRQLMWNYVGIVRSTKRLERALHRLENIHQEIKEYYSNMKVHPDIVELRNISLVALLTVRCALLRKESRGIHYSLNFPESSFNVDDWEKGLAHDSSLTTL